MLKDLTGAEWIEMLEIPADRIPIVAILRGTRNLRRNYDVYAQRFDDIVEIGSPNGLFEDLFIGRHRNLNIGYASVYGDAMASEITHVFGAIGTRLVIQTGCCGALQPSVQAGDLMIPSRAIPGEGAAQYYLPGANAIQVSGDMLRLAASLVRPCWPYYTGPIFTTSALLAEGEAELRAWEDAGHVAVDMETATTFAVAESFGMKRLAILHVFDNPLHGDTLIHTGEERAERRQRGERAMFEVLTSVLNHIATKGFE
jgi:purine-nucleoside phosphorylase